ncbi:DUF6932 family protein [Pedobacter jejuensis]|uniref:Nucleotidyltransferase domain-containing protein n=1 Tax=Pedobacter jejuensis TaxID=1268550 RepID=A0A3N0C2B2_9SPHI|nr:hypothetical protein [Pedobacter jejuensis]RNL55878.1 hypothetical protein D7004_03755 [Pedobacter jejuensis]
MLTFNHKGHLVPNNNIRSTLDELKTEFVDAFTFSSTKRSDLYKNYLQYSNDLKTVLQRESLLQWIDGSYVTKKQEPSDIDLVTFIDGTIVDSLEALLEPFKYPQSVVNYGVDAYLVKVYDRGDKRYPLFIGDQIYWMDLFDKTQRSRNGQKHPKGFLEIIY